MAAITSDTSYEKKLTTEVTIETNGTILKANLEPLAVGQKETVLMVDTAIWYSYYKSVWYPQNVSPFV